MRGQNNNNNQSTSKLKVAPQSVKQKGGSNNNNNESTITLPRNHKDDITGVQDTIYLCNFRVSVDGEWLCLKELQDGVNSQKQNEGAPIDESQNIVSNNKCNEKIVERDWVNYYFANARINVFLCYSQNYTTTPFKCICSKFKSQTYMTHSYANFHTKKLQYILFGSLYS
ncbi:hypothetical protein PVAND_003051 [Polypedilum vanderplanki]|uniref:Uncharacterized protein n=1 Tax=Polypedilum vanderplanki TaxID=319348 RepID=A0A9J6BSW2_POLVA|nr:hypothetical protein PVAND_003051 [Polypedilum vanderplanki]